MDTKNGISDKICTPRDPEEVWLMLFNIYKTHLEISELKPTFVQSSVLCNQLWGGGWKGGEEKDLCLQYNVISCK